jgi:hypothetical protein
MASDLLDASEVFCKRVKECATVLERHYAFDLMSHFRSTSGWNGALEASVGLTALQIGLVDILDQEHGIKPDGFLGHSAGTRSFSALGLPHFLCYCAIGGKVEGGFSSASLCLGEYTDQVSEYRIQTPGS